MKTISFDQLPEAVNQILEKLNKIEKLLNEQSSTTKTPVQDQLLTVQQAADFLSLAVPTVYGMVSKGLLPYMKRSKRLYFDRNDLMRYLTEGRQSSTSEDQIQAIYEFKAGRR